MVNMLNMGNTSAGWETQVFAWMQEKNKDYKFVVFFSLGKPIPDKRHKVV